MTGDGVNDVLALKDADCGIAMASGAEAACQVAQLVLLDSDFAAMPKVVAEGRRVINNIQRAVGAVPGEEYPLLLRWPSSRCLRTCPIPSCPSS